MTLGKSLNHTGFVSLTEMEEEGMNTLFVINFCQHPLRVKDGIFLL